MKEYDQIVEQANKENEILFREEREEKLKKNEKIREYEQTHLQNMEKRDPYKTKISTMSLTKARNTAQAKGSGSFQSLSNLPGARYGQDTIKENPKGELSD